MKGRSTETYEKVFAECDQKKSDRQTRLKSLEAQAKISGSTNPKAKAAKITEAPASIEKVLAAQELPPAEKQSVLASIIQTVVPSDEGVTMTLKPSNEQIIKTACPHDCPDTCSMLATDKRFDVSRILRYDSSGGKKCSQQSYMISLTLNIVPSIVW